MDEKLLVVLIGMLSGCAGYLIATFWMKPILQYRELRLRVFSDFIFYAQVVNANDLNERMQDLFESRVLANRRNSADLAACLIELPRWYLWYIRRKGQSPERAVEDLIGYSNTTEYEAAAKKAFSIKKHLGLSSGSE